MGQAWWWKRKKDWRAWRGRKNGGGGRARRRRKNASHVVGNSAVGCRKECCWIKSVPPLLIFECGMEQSFFGSLLLWYIALHTTSISKRIADTFGLPFSSLYSSNESLQQDTFKGYCWIAEGRIEWEKRGMKCTIVIGMLFGSSCFVMVSLCSSGQTAQCRMRLRAPIVDTVF